MERKLLNTNADKDEILIAWKGTLGRELKEKLDRKNALKVEGANVERKIAKLKWEIARCEGMLCLVSRSKSN